jgi:ABC-type uncharacterized transport system permease subunit
MSEQATSGPAFLAPVARLWQRITPGLVPVLAVITAFIIGIPFMIFSSVVTGKSVGEGLRVSGVGYSSLIEGATGFVINDQVSADNAEVALLIAQTNDLKRGDLTRLAQNLNALVNVDSETVHRYGAVLNSIDLEDEALETLGGQLPNILEIGPDTLRAMQPFVEALGELERSEVRVAAGEYAALESLDAEARAEMEALVPAAADFTDEDLLTYWRVINDHTIVAVERAATQQAILDEIGITADSDDAATLAEIAPLGAASVRQWVAAQNILDAANVTDVATASEQLTMVRRMYEENLLTHDDVQQALEEEFHTAVTENLVVRRPGNRILAHHGGTGLAGILYTDPANTPDDPSDDKPSTIYLRLFGSAALFFPANLEATLVRSMPFVLAGLAVALGFKSGVFNIGAEGQLYAAGILAVWVGYHEAFSGLPAFIHLPLVIIAGLIGGFLWGAVPGMLKAFTGAHEVITTIMLNFVAILTTDWLIKSTKPIIMQDPSASISRTPYIAESARLPLFSNLGPLFFLIVGVLLTGMMLYSRRDLLKQNIRYAIRPVLYGLIAFLGGMLIAWLSVRNTLHVGLILMIAAVWLTDWFLERTTLGFELRTVGVNPHAARYAGISVPRNIILAMAISGALAGLAATLQVAGVQFNLQPEFFSGVGFNAIAVALLARKNPRNMIAAGLLWGGLLAGAPLMQLNANISIDLVVIIQALIIMFIAADAIIRYLWRVPEASAEQQSDSSFAKGWGG